ncbi:MAG: sigma-70 family RNA polymerase sigma factor [Planctomycetota bacterium]
MQTTLALADSPWSDLINQARVGDAASLGQIVREVHSYLLAIAEAQVGSGLRGKFGPSDIVQQSLMEASQTMDSFRGTTEAELRSWLKRIVLHNLTDAARQYTSTQSRDASREVPIDAHEKRYEVACSRSPTASWLVSRREQSVQLLRAVNRLPERQRVVVEGRHRWGKSYQQIADELDVTENAARSLWSRAMHNLREMLSENDDQPRRRAERD